MPKPLEPTVGSAFKIYPQFNHLLSLLPLPTTLIAAFISYLMDAINLLAFTLLFLPCLYSQSRHRNLLEQKLDLFTPLPKTLQHFFLLTQSKKPSLGHGPGGPASLSMPLFISCSAESHTQETALISGSLYLYIVFAYKGLSSVSCLTPSPTIFGKDFLDHFIYQSTFLSASNLYPLTMLYFFT